MPDYTQTCDDLMLLLESFKKVVFELAEAHHLTRPQLFVLYWISKQGELAMGQVAAVLHCDASNVTGIVDRLVVRKLIVRHEATHDRRTKTLRLTKQGTALIEQLTTALPQKLGCESLNTAEQKALHSVAQKLSV